MTRFKIQRIEFFVFLLSFLLLQLTACNGSFREKHEAQDLELTNTKINNERAGETISISLNNKLINLVTPRSVHDVSVNNSKQIVVNITSKDIIKSSTTYSPVTPTIQMTNGMHIPSLHYGAFLRGVFVVIGLSVLVMIYMVFRGFRLNKSRAQMVRKYGVLAHRQDVEMRPLPLDEDDDDDNIVFDASNISPSNQLQSQNA